MKRAAGGQRGRGPRPRVEIRRNQEAGASTRRGRDDCGADDVPPVTESPRPRRKSSRSRTPPRSLKCHERSHPYHGLGSHPQSPPSAFGLRIRPPRDATPPLSKQPIFSRRSAWSVRVGQILPPRRRPSPPACLGLPWDASVAFHKIRSPFRPDRSEASPATVRGPRASASAPARARTQPKRAAATASEKCGLAHAPRIVHTDRVGFGPPERRTCRRRL